MTARLWGKKIGMTQVFSNDKVIPVTAIDLGRWLVTNVKTKERDGYHAVQIGHVKDRYQLDAFSQDWLKKQNVYFDFIKEMHVPDESAEYVVGKPARVLDLIAQGDNVDVTGTTKGHGFAGGVRRHGFTGGLSSHGSNMGKRPGSVSSYRSQGRIIKGKRLPGHMGFVSKMVKHLEIVQIDQDAHLILVSGSVPGKNGSLLCVRKAK